ncbi:hypothetical protein [Bosea vaviloviae]|uniref:Right handed beta helix domain-containing protein n=1 Tax=Bosea vaviloviae TaxID=1526658 RepID=A0A1D7U2S0_9HYPH|nr:hypothetical protein [Bosea vaviloviae]AOO81668.1 hypothetical protein BHK69_15475 [Bosea vaviloviae]
MPDVSIVARGPSSLKMRFRPGLVGPPLAEDDFATQAEAEAGTDAEKVMSPLRAAQQTTARLASQAVAEAGADNDKLMSSLRTAQQTTARLASQAVAEAGTDNDKLTSPLRTKQQIDARLAVDADSEALTDTAKLMVPAQVRVAIERAEFSYEDMAHPATLSDIIQRTGSTPLFEGAAAADANHASAINSCIDRVITNGGGIAWLPPIAPGVDWKIGGPIYGHKTGVTGSRVKIQGVGQQARLKVTAAGGDVFVVGDGTNPVYYVYLRDLYIYRDSQPSGQRDVVFTHANICEVHNFISDGSVEGVRVEHGNSIYFNRCHINMPYAVTGIGARVVSSPATAYRTDIVVFDEFTVQANCAGSHGLVISGRVAGVHTNGFYALGVKRGLQMISTSTALADLPSFCAFYKFEVDRATEAAAVLDRGFRTEFHRCDISNTSGAVGQGGADTAAVFVGENMLDTKFIGGRITNCQRQAVDESGKRTQYIGTTFSDMSKAGAGSYSAVLLNPTARGFKFIGCDFDCSSRAAYALSINAAAKNGIIKDNTYRDVVTAFNTGTGTNVTMADNVNDT